METFPWIAGNDQHSPASLHSDQKCASQLQINQLSVKWGSLLLLGSLQVPWVTGHSSSWSHRTQASTDGLFLRWGGHLWPPSLQPCSATWRPVHCLELHHWGVSGSDFPRSSPVFWSHGARVLGLRVELRTGGTSGPPDPLWCCAIDSTL